MNARRKYLSTLAFALAALGASATATPVAAATCLGNANKCSYRCESKYYGDAVRADRCEQNCNTAYNACIARNQPRRPLPSDPPPKHKRPADANPGNRGVQPSDPKRGASTDAGKSSGSHSVRSSK